MSQESKTVCWNAIVKNEANIIERCMQSMVNEIDYWLVVDTGSTDGTQDIIRSFMEKHGVPGELVERPWKNFSHNRSEALELAEDKADYILFCDADMALQVVDDNWKQFLHDAPAYMVDQKTNRGVSYGNIRLVNGRLKGDRRFRYWGATHEYCSPINPDNYQFELFNHIVLLDFADGGAKSDKYERDVRLLTDQLNALEYLRNEATAEERQAAWHSGLLRHADMLTNRCTFYLAQTWKDSDSPEMALANYIKRAKLGGWDEEVWYSLLEIAALKEKLGYPDQEVIQAYLEAYENRPQRAETLYHLARYLRTQERYALAYVYALSASKTPLPDDILFILTDVYDWKAKDELAICCYWIGYYEQAEALCTELLENPSVPESALPRIRSNLEYAVSKQSG